MEKVFRKSLSNVRPIPRRGLSRDEAAMYLGVSANKFDELDDRFHETTQLLLGLSIHGMRPFRTPPYDSNFGNARLVVAISE
jgi:hypothetical protein